ncbi:MAG: DUF6036 family nucleotidyltransferase [Lachnospiraceae bacterium]|nr:DUF6036 family nucleotidyltransferase [Lachnospiraceae bacterium]
MSFEITGLTKENLDGLLKELAKAYKRLTHGRAHAELILVGGAAVLANYFFRESTMDIDAVILADSAIKDAANQVADRYGLPGDWLNADFRKTASFSEKLRGISKHYRTYANVVEYRTVTDEYLIAMKLVSARDYKYDHSDIAGILYENEEKGTPITKDDIYKAVVELYGDWEIIPENSRSFIQDAFAAGNFKKLYEDTRNIERENKEMLNSFAEKYPNTIRRSNINDILASLQEKKV